MILTEKKLLSECGNLLVIDDGADDITKKYQIEIDSGDYLVISAGMTLDKAASRFTHQNIVMSQKEIYEFKHYRASGRKFYTSQAGITHTFIVPKNKIYILPNRGYSYIDAEINGVKVTFNVGGGSSNGWTDWLHSEVHIFVNCPLKNFKKIMEVAVRGTALEPSIIQKLHSNLNTVEMDTEKLARWEEAAKRVSKDNKKQREQFFKMVEEDKNPIIVLNQGYAETEGIALELQRAGEWIDIGEGKRQLDFDKGRVKRILCHFDGRVLKTRVKFRQVNWVKTCERNFKTA